MPNHHPTQNSLLEHVAGTQSWSLSLAVSAHLQMCNACRQRIHELNHIGGILLEAAPADVPPISSLQEVLARIETTEREHATRDRWREKASANPFARPEQLSLGEMPAVLRRLLPAEQDPVWKRLSLSVEALDLGVLDEQDRIGLCRVAPGGRFYPPSDGAEVVLVLSGSFSDASGRYGPGDFLVSKANARLAALDEPCIYFSLTRAADTWRSFRRPGILTQLKRYMSGVSTG